MRHDKDCNCKPVQGLPPLAAHGQCEKQDHVLCLHPGDWTCPYLRRRELSLLSLDAARAEELGLSYGQYKAREVVR